MINQPRHIRVDDLTWLNMDRPNNLMAVSGLLLFRDEPGRAATEAAVMERIVDRFPVFRCRPVQIDGTWCWEEDVNFSVERQVSRLVLGGSADLSALQHHISVRHAVPMPKDRPQWRFEMISGVHGIYESGPVTALYCRFHHSLADGIRLIQLLLSLLDSEADAAPRSKVGRPAAEHHSLPEFTQGLAMGSVGNMVDLVQGTVRGGIRAASSLRIRNFGLPSMAALSRARDQARPTAVIEGVAGLSSPENRLVNTLASAGKLLVGTRAARTVWSGVPGEAKTLGWIDGIDLDRVKAEAKRAGATVNDVLLSAVAGGLGRYLVEHGDSKLRETPWMVPVALLPLDDNLPRELGNHFTLVNLSLPIGLDDAGMRLREINTRMTRLKYSDEAMMMFGLSKIVARAPKTISYNLTNMVANRNMGLMSNVPGPTVPMSLAGAEVAGMVGWVPTSGDQTISACMLSYNRQVFIGLCTDDLLIPDPNRVAHHITEELVSVGLRARPTAKVTQVDGEKGHVSR